MTQPINKDFDNLFNDVIDLSERVKDKAVKDRLEKASEFILMASQAHLLGKTQGVDLTKLGVKDERNMERRHGDRRHTR